jgi:hypothetical protein
MPRNNNSGGNQNRGKVKSRKEKMVEKHEVKSMSEIISNARQGQFGQDEEDIRIKKNAAAQNLND